ncbi:MAG: cytochrome c-type biogenesis protein [Methylophilaceae bacterium]
MRKVAKVYLSWLFCFFLCSASISLIAATQTEENPQIEARLKALSTELRCLVCQNSTLADSDAALATDLRNEIRTLMQKGKTDEEVVSYLVARYGDFVRYRPPVNATTALLWFGPFLMLLIGGIALIVVLKKRASQLNEDAPRDEL